MEATKILYGSSVSPLEVDDEKLEGQQEDASIQYDMQDTIDLIGTDDFKSSYMNVIGQFKALSIDYQKTFCIRALEKIEESYEFQFTPRPEFENQVQINNLYEILEFLEYDYIDFASGVWKFLKVELQGVDIDSYCKSNSDKVISEIEDQIETRDFSELISNFMRTYNKEGMIRLFIHWTEKNRMLIVLRIREGETGE